MAVPTVEMIRRLRRTLAGHGFTVDDVVLAVSDEDYGRMCREMKMQTGLMMGPDSELRILGVDIRKRSCL